MVPEMIKSGRVMAMIRFKEEMVTIRSTARKVMTFFMETQVSIPLMVEPEKT